MAEPRSGGSFAVRVALHVRYGTYLARADPTCRRNSRADVRCRRPHLFSLAAWHIKIPREFSRRSNCFSSTSNSFHDSSQRSLDAASTRCEATAGIPGCVWAAYCICKSHIGVWLRTLLALMIDLLNNPNLTILWGYSDNSEQTSSPRALV